MGFDSILRSGVALIDSLTASLQATVEFHAWIGYDRTGGPLYDAPLIFSAIIEEKQFTHKLETGAEITQRASILLPRPIAANGATDRREPIDLRDKFVLPSGYTGPI